VEYALALLAERILIDGDRVLLVRISWISGFMAATSLPAINGRP